MYKRSSGRTLTKLGAARSSATTTPATRRCSANASPRPAAHKSTVAEQALGFFGQLYDVEREVANLDVDERRRIRQLKAKPVADDLFAWLVAQRQKVPDGSATARAIDYSLNRWTALTRYLGNGHLPADNNWIENRIRPVALGRNNWLFAGSLRAGQRAAAIMSLIGSAKMNGLDPYAYLGPAASRNCCRIAGARPARTDRAAARQDGFAARLRGIATIPRPPEGRQRRSAHKKGRRTDRPPPRVETDGVSGSAGGSGCCRRSGSRGPRTSGCPDCRDCLPNKSGSGTRPGRTSRPAPAYSRRRNS